MDIADNALNLENSGNGRRNENGSSGKDYIKEITRMINDWFIESPIRECAMYALHVMPTLLLQKPSKSSKVKTT